MNDNPHCRIETPASIQATDDLVGIESTEWREAYFVITGTAPVVERENAHYLWTMARRDLAARVRDLEAAVRSVRQECRAPELCGCWKCARGNSIMALKRERDLELVADAAFETIKRQTDYQAHWALAEVAVALKKAGYELDEPA